MTNTITENKNTDTVAQARDLVLATMFVGNMPDFEYYSGDPRWEPAVSQCKAENEKRLNALIAAVRAECADRVRGLYDALVTVAEIQERGPDTTIARVHQAYDMRCVARQSLAALEAQ